MVQIFFPAQQKLCQPVTKDEYCVHTVDRKSQNKQKECWERHQKIMILCRIMDKLCRHFSTMKAVLQTLSHADNHGALPSAR
jgi:hypothetical protein